MGFKKQITGLDEDQIKKFIKISICNGYYKKILKSKTFKNSSYLEALVDESTNELEDFINFITENIDCPEEQLKYIENHLKF